MVRASESFVARAAPADVPDGNIRECGAAVGLRAFRRSASLFCGGPFVQIVGRTRMQQHRENASLRANGPRNVARSDDRPAKQSRAACDDREAAWIASSPRFSQ